MKFFRLFAIICFSSICSCQKTESIKKHDNLTFSQNILNYQISPKTKFDKSGLMFSDQGAWFAFSLSDSNEQTGFSGPFLMTQQNGIWASQSLSELIIGNTKWNLTKTESFASHLTQQFTSKNLELQQTLLFTSGHSTFVQSEIKNTSKIAVEISYHWKNKPILADELSFSTDKNTLIINSSKTDAVGYIQFPEAVLLSDSLNYKTDNKTITIQPNESIKLEHSTSFIFSEYSWSKEKTSLENNNFSSVLNIRKKEKKEELSSLISNLKPQFKDSIYKEVIAKAHLTLQNNWRIPAGEIEHEGLFPSYHYKWFNGFWSWDSWKHAVGLSYYNLPLAKEQMKLMFKFQKEDGFVADCVYRDTLIEPHNWRDTKPPLSAWAVAKIYEKDNDVDFVSYMYPKLKKYHEWWYNKRDHDKDGICEYGSTDGSAIAAKWESGMDNAIRFDNVEMLKNSEGAYSMNQESVDLNAYLYAEKLYLSSLAKALNKIEDQQQFEKEAAGLKTKIQQQFFDNNDGWFYDTNLNGTTFIKGEGSEGWTALWAKAATKEQAKAVKDRMLNPSKFYTKVPFQTMSADHPKFDPLKGYWRGPNWLDQSYFGVKSLRKYNFNQEADKATKDILKGADGLLGKGVSIRENYHPLTGKGGNAKNFSWSAAHILMLLENN